MSKSKYRKQFVEAALDWENIELSEFNRTEKYNKMKLSAFAFYRGTDHLFWTDFGQKNYPSKFSTKKTKTWLQGDLHAYNFGTFNDDKGQLVYGLNDFDEGVIADYQYDVWRMATSLVIISRENGASKSKNEKEYVHAFAQSYYDHLKKIAKQKVKDLPYTRKNLSDPLSEFLKLLESKEKGARKKMLDKWTKNNKFDTSLPQLDKVSKKEREGIIEAIEGSKGKLSFYRNTLVGPLTKKKQSYFKVIDVAERKLQGTGSLGTKRYYVLIEGDKKSRGDDIILDVKHQGRPSSYPYLSNEDLKRYRFDNEAHRCTEAFRALSKATDDYAGWVKLYKVSKEAVRGYYSVRERSPEKDSYPALASELKKATINLSLRKKTNFLKMCRMWGEILASAHARSDNDANKARIDYSFEKEVIKVIGNKAKDFVNLVYDVGNKYADQVRVDYGIFIKMLKKRKSK